MKTQKAKLEHIVDNMMLKDDVKIKSKDAVSQLEEIKNKGFLSVFENNNLHLSLQPFYDKKKDKNELGIAVNFTSDKYPDKKLSTEKLAIIDGSLVKSIKQLQLDLTYTRGDYCVNGVPNELGRMNEERIRALHHTAGDVLDRVHQNKIDARNMQDKIDACNMQDMKPKVNLRPKAKRGFERLDESKRQR